MTRTRPILLVVSALLFGCARAEAPLLTESPAGFPLAYVMQDCAPWDGAATMVYLASVAIDPEAPWGSEVARPYAWISIYEPPMELAGRRFEIDQDRIAGAMRCEDEGPCEPATAGWVRISEVSPLYDLVGDFQLTFEDLTVIRGGFEAEHHRRQVICG